jgi:regulatory protein
MLSRRELSAAQVQQRLARRGYDAEDIAAALARLRQERALDDDRTAEAIAHTEAVVRRHGRRRVRRRIEQAGIDRGTARRAADAVFGTLDEAALLDEALARRLRGRETIADESELLRLHRFLVSQGFDPDRVLLALNERRKR